MRFSFMAVSCAVRPGPERWRIDEDGPEPMRAPKTRAGRNAAAGVRNSPRPAVPGGEGARTGRAQSSLIVFTSTPTLSMSISTLSPGFIHIGGVRREPTPPGVPVTITSPGTSSVKVEM